MTQQEYLKKFADVIGKMYSITEAKNHDYSSDSDAFKNFKTVEHFRENVSAIDGIYIRMTDKFARVSNLLDRPAMVVDEKVEDTLLDLANYSIILLIYLHAVKEEQCVAPVAAA